jgi:hypothetical protein
MSLSLVKMKSEATLMEIMRENFNLVIGNEQ